MKKWRSLIILSYLLLVFVGFSFAAGSVNSSKIESPYKLPYPAGKEYTVTQGNFGQKSHNPYVDGGKAIYAFDFNLKDGDLVVVSRSGQILSIQDGFDRGRCDETLGNYVNYVLIDHEDGTSSLYLHLKKGSITVKESQEVSQGQIIAQADASGYVCGRTGEHLHFQVQETPQNIWMDSEGKKRGWYTQSIQISFSDADVLAKTPDGIPIAGERYISDNAAPEVITPPPEVSCPPEGETKFSQGQEVITTDTLKVRENPGLASREIKTQPKGISGKILEGPVCADNYVWWKVEYKDGTIGWSAENWLEAKLAEVISPEEAVSPEILTIINPDLNFSLSDFKIYEERKAPRKPDGYIFLILHEEGVNIEWPEISATGIDFQLKDEGIYQYGDIGDILWLVYVNPQLSYRINLEDYDGEEIALFQVTLKREGDKIKSNFIFVANSGRYGIVPPEYREMTLAHGGRIGFSISAIGDGIRILGPPKSFGIEVRKTLESDVIIP